MTTQHSSKKPVIAAAVSIVLLVAAGAVWLHLHEDPHHAHAHHHEAMQPQLNAGERWESEPQLRSSMVAIRDAVAAASATMPVTDEAAKSLPKVVDEQVDLIVKNCKLAPEADATLHTILSGLITGAQTLANENQRTEGLATMRTALEEYPKYFNHPDWQPLPDRSK